MSQDQKTSAQGVACPREISLVAEIRHRRRSKVACLQELTGTVAIPTRTAAMERLHCCRGPTSGEPCAAGPPPRFHQFLADGLCGVTSGVGSGAGSAAKKGQQKILAQRKVFPPLTTEVSRSSPLAFRYGEALLIAVGTRNTRLERCESRPSSPSCLEGLRSPRGVQRASTAQPDWEAVGDRRLPRCKWLQMRAAAHWTGPAPPLRHACRRSNGFSRVRASHHVCVCV